ncbi:MAG TPA: hypothetical protein VGC97_01695, partial [Pyrinomonadaceae bacterium]
DATAKVSVSTAKAQQAVPVKITRHEKSAVIKNNPVAASAEKPVKKAKTEPISKAPAASARAKKPPVGKISEPKKPLPLKRKAAPTEEKNVKKAAISTSAKIFVSPTKAKKSAAVNQTVKPKKVVAPAPLKKSKPEKATILPKASDKKVESTRKKAVTAVSGANPPKRKKTKTIAEETKPVTVAAKPASKAKTIKAAEKTSEKKRAKKGGIIVQPITPKLGKKEKAAEKKVEIVIPTVTEKPVKKKIKPIGSAVVRGKNGRYDFEVFPLDADLKDGSAIYVISKRVTDKRGRGHHKFVCIGQSDSLLGEIKKHKKDKCIKQHNANVICLLREENAANRLKIETDLREAHAIACNQK